MSTTPAVKNGKSKPPTAAQMRAALIEWRLYSLAMARSPIISTEDRKLWTLANLLARQSGALK